MASLASINLVGRLGRDPETRYTPGGKMNVQFTVAVSRRRTSQDGEVTEQADWYRCTTWGRLAETADRMAQNGWLAKGREVVVVGNLEPREYKDQHGATRTSLDVNVNELVLVGPSTNAEPNPQPSPYAGTQAPF